MRAQPVTLDYLAQLMDPRLCTPREYGLDQLFPLLQGIVGLVRTGVQVGQFHLFIALAILERHRDVIIDTLKQLDKVPKYINVLCTTIELSSTQICTEALFYKFQ
ncbi:unnamed protein product [Tuber melanosporum]|uniref:(Perigord truffle) hypothetical protein n=1 Tax=Tuber melanosporum (strain Mel28) TaxID=656061 RepID=D5GF39_TUBMM|nr:uncharacterized protein GSTUM_00001831001 [Tuber melanosporum]CAZ83132.1 unnamed protein product [Tuber melanosporum]